MGERSLSGRCALPGPAPIATEDATLADLGNQELLSTILRTKFPQETGEATASLCGTGMSGRARLTWTWANRH